MLLAKKCQRKKSGVVMNWKQNGRYCMAQFMVYWQTNQYS